MRLVLAPILLSLVGCTYIPRSPWVINSDFHVAVQEDPSLKKYGQARLLFKGDELVSCEIVLRKYPVCLLHELRHCIEGDWHPRDEPNTEDC